MLRDSRYRISEIGKKEKSEANKRTREQGAVEILRAKTRAQDDKTVENGESKRAGET
jgi:hypothetical protein